jgi:pyridoxal phosphate phosphatase PHOSPHO2
MASAPAPGVVVVFDFDRTIIDWDSDDWVITKLGAADAFRRLRPTMHWNPLMVHVSPSADPRIDWADE